MEFTKLAIPDVILVKPTVFGDQRGFFLETYVKAGFAAGGIEAEFVQDNHSKSAQGVLRGLHYQIRQPQGKLVRVTAGEVFDVAVDLRRSSPTFGKWVGARLSAGNFHMLWVPVGFAHGFYVTSPAGAEFQYKCTDYYAPEHERVISWNDPAIGIDWPLVNGRAPTLAAKDASGVLLKDAECFA
ncbi:MAG: dTDP-4-dehydrorhamnose 3,5-epimerase [Thiotrichales bacterium SG8_50]|jgi:dTDP-4-dehydrorhamnose 3,5-epimerase|nr:MAG: dTDP-4-dehydrorhamnose 3,5-epimerase [Thiotrichales bacterium SG8_50]